MAQRVRKVPYLETSPETFLLLDGSGYFSTDSPTRTGNPSSGTPKQRSVLFSPTVTPLNSPLDDTLQQMMEKEPENLRESGDSGATSCDLLLFWNHRREIPMK